eukprot:gene19559-23430_t
MFGWKNKTAPSGSGAKQPHVTAAATSAPVSVGVSSTATVSEQQVAQSPLIASTSSPSSTADLSSSFGASPASASVNVMPTTSVLAGAPIVPTSVQPPPILAKFVRYLLAKGTTTEHIFRAHPELDSEVAIVRKNLLKDINLGDIEALQLSSFTNNTHVVAELTRAYLYALPEPLFSYHLYDSFLLTHTILSQQDRIWAYRYLLAYLPPGFQAAIKNLLGLLSRVHQNCSSTKMDANALATVFAPVFLRPEEDMYYMRADRATIEEIVALWIEEFDNVSKPPTPATTKITTSAASFTPVHPATSNASAALDPLSATPSNSTERHPTIGLNKINTATAQLTNATNPQQSPKLSLPTIPKQQNTQQTTTIIKVKPPLQASSSTPGSSQSPPILNLSGSSKPTSPIAQHVAAPSAKSSSSPITTTPSVSSPVAVAKTPSTQSAPSTNANTSSNTNTTTTNPSASSATTTPKPVVLTLLTNLDPETADKINRVRGTTDSLINEHVWGQLKTVSRNIEKETLYNTTIRISTKLRDSKRHLMESTEKLLQLSKADVKAFLKENPMPETIQTMVTEITGDQQQQQQQGVDDAKHLELKRASKLAIKELADYIHCLKCKLNTFVHMEHVVLTAQIISKLKAILDSAVSGGTSALSISQGGDDVTHSPPASPSTEKRKSLSPSEDNKTTLRVVEVCSKEINERLKVMRRELEHASLQEAVDIGKAIRSTKQTLQELYTENNYPLPTEVKVSPSANDDQLTTLKRTLEPLLDRIVLQVDTVVKTVANRSGSDQECKNIVDKLLFVNKVLSL